MACAGNLGNAGRKFRGRALPAGIVVRQDELAAALSGEQPVEQGGARIADVQRPVGDGEKRTIGEEAIAINRAPRAWSRPPACVADRRRQPPARPDRGTRW
jgi:hypothetical protein